MPFTMRLRVSLNKTLTSENEVETFELNGWTVEIRSEVPDAPLTKSKTVIFRSEGFHSEAEAQEFGNRFKASCDSAAAACGLGMDTGVGKTISALFKGFRDHIKENSGYTIRANVHGLDVYEDDGFVRHFVSDARGYVSQNIDNLTDTLSRHFANFGPRSDAVTDAITLLNYSLLRPDPIASAILCISSVEAVGQNADWSSAQKSFLASIGAKIESSDLMEGEKAELQQAVSRIPKKGLAQGVRELLQAQGQSDLYPIWRSMYKERSRLVHGIAPIAGVDYTTFARNSVHLCANILAGTIDREIDGFASDVQRFFSIEELKRDGWKPTT